MIGFEELIYWIEQGTYILKRFEIVTFIEDHFYHKNIAYGKGCYDS